MKWYKVPGIPISDQPFIKKVKVRSKTICLVGYNDEVFALSASCPHAGGDLSEGWCKEKKIICPVHRYSYDLLTGKGSPGQNDFINTYLVKTEDQEIYVGISSFLEKLAEMLKR